MNLDLGLLLIRLGIGGIFLSHGWSKLANIEGTISFFSQLGIDPILTYIVAIAEFLGGISMILGLFTRWSGIGLAFIMAGAILLLKIGDGFSGEYELILLLSSLGVSLSGSGAYSIEKTLYQKS